MADKKISNNLYSGANGKYGKCPECKAKFYNNKLITFEHCHRCGWDLNTNNGDDYVADVTEEYLDMKRTKVELGDL